ncbi:MAG: helix-turn-helix transcriptional regulator [Methylococcaceae bacterium]
MGGLSRSTLYGLVRQGILKPVQPGPRTTGFLESEINDWLKSRLDTRQ